MSAFARVNDEPAVPCTLAIEREIEMVYTDGAMAPDMAWQTVDDMGHFHAYSEDKSLPTLRRRDRHVPCDGACGGVCGGEGYTAVEYVCAICGRTVDPGVLPERGPIAVPGRKSWSVEIQDAPGTPYPVGHVVIVRVESEDGDLYAFGVAKVAGSDIRVTRSRMTYSCTLINAGPLGTRSVKVPIKK